ncbi:hypothetical protein CEE45_08020, partial [Candidatus Heimdallarchaeota archaeon B3_Heim]
MTKSFPNLEVSFKTDGNLASLKEQLKTLLDLSESETIIFMHLLANDKLTATEIAKATGIQRTRTYEIFRHLREKELIELTSEDISRIADRISQMVVLPESQTSATASCTCDSEMVCTCGICVEKKPDTFRKFMDFGVDRLGIEFGTGGECVPEDIAHCIDHTILKPDATHDDIITL